ncbi:hypothetical protein A0H81_09905, partial [Grifola frondosa]
FSGPESVNLASAEGPSVKPSAKWARPDQQGAWDGINDCDGSEEQACAHCEVVRDMHYHCLSCTGWQLACTSCLVKSHQNLPLHHIEVCVSFFQPNLC